MSYTIQRIGEFTKIVYSGDLLPSDIISARNELAILESDIKGTLKRLTVVSGITNFEINYSTLWPICQNFKELSHFHKIKSALVATKPIEIGLARMWQTLISDGAIDCQIFDSIDKAVNWLSTE